jgi:hypothetical protein
VLQRQSASAGGTTDIPPIVHDVLDSSGQSLDAGTRAFFESRFGYDFSNVRVHADVKAAESAQALNALAYTVGSDVVFDQGFYDPYSHSGRKLLAHELAHVVQQQGEAALSPVKIGDPDDAAEGDADRLAAQVTAPVNPTGIAEKAGTTGRVQRSAGKLQRVVNERKVGCRNTGIPSLGLSGADAVQAIRDANAEAIVLAQRAENLLTFERLTFGLGAPGAGFTTILNEELGLDINNAADRRRIEIVERRFAAIRTRVLESDFTGHTCVGAAAVSLAPGTPVASAGDCCTGAARACSSSGVSHIVLCRPWWTGDVALRPGTLIHEPFHIFFDFDDFANARLNDAHCYTAFAMRLAGSQPFVSCTNR